jgi:hypothetical protein
MLPKNRVGRRQFQSDEDFVAGRNFGGQVSEFRTETQARASAGRGADDPAGYVGRIAEPKGSADFFSRHDICNDALGFVEAPGIARRRLPPIRPSAEESEGEQE